MKFIKKHKVLLICLGVLLILMIIALLAIKEYLYPDDSKDKYGNRLDGINEVLVSDDTISKIKTTIKETKGVVKCEYILTGKIIKVFVTVDATIDITKAKDLSTIILDNLDENQKSFYDIQYYVDCSEENELYPIIGSKHKTSATFVWTEKKGVLDEK